MQNYQGWPSTKSFSKIKNKLTSKGKGLNVSVDRCTAGLGTWRAAEVNKEDKERERES